VDAAGSVLDLDKPGRPGRPAWIRLMAKRKTLVVCERCHHDIHAGRATAAPAADRVIPGYTKSMKTAISVPDEIFQQAASQAAELGISRSEFFARAARKYLDELAAQSLTSQIDQALQAAGGDDSGAAAAAAGRRLLAGGDDDW
jgi:hypothetical protein